MPNEGEALVKWDASGLEHTYLVGRYNLNEPAIHAHNKSIDIYLSIYLDR